VQRDRSRIGTVTRKENIAMKIVIIGGTGLIGSKLAQKLRAHGHEALAAAPSTGVDTITGAGLSEALKGATVAVDVSNSPSFEADAVMRFFDTSTRNVLAAETRAGVKHHVALSIVGTDRSPDNAYFQAKLAQERLIRASSIPYSILHATQFFEFTKAIAATATSGDTMRVPPVLYQPVAAEDVASELAQVTLAPPLNGDAELAGPERFTLDALVRIALDAWNDPRKVVTDPEALYYGSRTGANALVPLGEARLGKIRFQDWLREQR
jgi:uncharacterized protein YbjT (DUF2867 family)